eukprot:6043298-Amphidinium_carterae.1
MNTSKNVYRFVPNNKKTNMDMCGVRQLSHNEADEGWSGWMPIDVNDDGWIGNVNKPASTGQDDARLSSRQDAQPTPK